MEIRLLGLLEHMAASGDPDLRWVARENLKKHRLRRWPARLDHVQALLDAQSMRKIEVSITAFNHTVNLT